MPAAFKRRCAPACSASERKAVAVGMFRRSICSYLSSTRASSTRSSPEEAVRSSSFSLSIEILGPVELGVVAVLGHQLLVGALLADAAVPHHQDAVGGADGGEGGGR